MLKALLKKQINELLAQMLRKGASNKNASNKSMLLYGLLFIYLFGVMGVMFYNVAFSVYHPFAAKGFLWLYFAVMAIFATAIGIVGSVFTAYSALYQAKDNELLLSMPIPPSKILLVRMMGIYIMAFAFEAVVTIPAFIVHFICGGANIASCVAAAVILFVLPLFALLLSGILGYLIALVSSKIKRKNIISVILLLAFIVGYYFVYSQMSSYLQVILLNTEKVSNTIRTAVYPLYAMGNGACGDILSLFVFVLIIGVLFALEYAVLARNFLKLTTTNKGTVHKKYREKIVKAASPSAALLRKELKRFASSPVYMLNCAMGSVFMIAAAVFAIVKRENVVMLFEAAGGRKMMPLILCAAFAVFSTMNTVTAPSISLEGKTLAVTRALPISSWQMLKAKLELHLLITAVPLLLSVTVVALVFRVDLFSGIAAIVCCMLFVLLCAAFGLLMNLKMPNLDWTNEVVVVKQSMSVMLAIFVPWIFVVVLGGAYALISHIISPTVYVCIVAVLIGVLDAIMLHTLKTKGTKMLEAL